MLLIGGPGCAGKSTFALELASELMRAGASASVLDLDCYLMERARRENGAVVISGYNPAGYLLDEAATDIRSLLAGRSIWVSPYDKLTSKRARRVRVDPARTLIVEGSMALSDPIYAFGDLSLFLDASEDVLYANRARREFTFGMTREAIDRKFAGLRPDYFKFIAPQRTRGDIVAEIDGDYSFTRVDPGVTSRLSPAWVSCLQNHGSTAAESGPLSLTS